MGNLPIRRYSFLALFSHLALWIFFFFIKLKINQKVKDRVREGERERGLNRDRGDGNAREYLKSEKSNKVQSSDEKLVSHQSLSKTQFFCSSNSKSIKTTTINASSTWIESIRSEKRHQSHSTESKRGKKWRVWSVNSLFRPSVKQPQERSKNRNSLIRMGDRCSKQAQSDRLESKVLFLWI